MTAHAGLLAGLGGGIGLVLFAVGLAVSRVVKGPAHYPRMCDTESYRHGGRWTPDLCVCACRACARGDHDPWRHWAVNR